MARDCRKYAPYHNSESTVSTYIRGIQGKLLKPILNFACFSIGLTRAHARGKVMGEERKEKKGPPISGFEDNSINTYFLQHLYWSIQYAGRRYRAALPGTHPIADIFVNKKRKRKGKGKYCDLMPVVSFSTRRTCWSRHYQVKNGPHLE